MDTCSWQVSVIAALAFAVLCADVVTAAEPDCATLTTAKQIEDALLDNLSADVNANEDSSTNG